VLVKDIVVSLAVTAALNVVCNCKASTDTPPTGNLTSLNLTWSFTCKPLLKNETVSVVLDAVVNGSFGNISSVAGSTLAGLTKFNACGSAVKGLG